MLITLIICCLVSYFVGALPFGLWIGLYFKGVDIRTLGSQNIGATNVLRIFGPKLGISAMVLDTFKGMVGIILARHLLPMQNNGETATFWMLMLVGILAVIGHTYSIFLLFKGGKGVSTTLGVLFALSWPVALVTFLVWLLIVAITRYVSLASIIGSLVIPVASYFLLTPPERWWMLALGIITALLVIVRHRSNIKRLLDGNEAKIGERVQFNSDPATAEAHSAHSQRGMK